MPLVYGPIKIKATYENGASLISFNFSNVNMDLVPANFSNVNMYFVPANFLPRKFCQMCELTRQRIDYP